MRLFQGGGGGALALAGGWTMYWEEQAARLLYGILAITGKPCLCCQSRTANTTRASTIVSHNSTISPLKICFCYIRKCLFGGPNVCVFIQMWNEVVCTIKGRKVFASDDDSAGSVEVENEV